ncbi:TPA: hypothetical protein ACL73O_001955, partial [Streptococcus pneumoniae]
RLPIFAKLSEKKLEYMMLDDCVMLVNEMEITDHRVDNLFEKGKNEIKDSCSRFSNRTYKSFRKSI